MGPGESRSTVLECRAQAAGECGPLRRDLDPVKDLTGSRPRYSSVTSRKLTGTGVLRPCA